MEESEKRKVTKIKQGYEEIKKIGECIASNDLIDNLADLKASAKSKSIAQSEESLQEYQQSVIYAGSIVFQSTPEVCKKLNKDDLAKSVENPTNDPKLRGGKCQFLDKTRKTIKQALDRDEIAVKQNGQPKMLKLTKNHKQGFDDSITEINALKKQYDCKYD